MTEFGNDTRRHACVSEWMFVRLHVLCAKKEKNLNKSLVLKKKSFNVKKKNCFLFFTQMYEQCWQWLVKTDGESNDSLKLSESSYI